MVRRSNGFPSSRSTKIQNATVHATPVVDDEIEQHRQQGNVAIVVQLADRDPELVEVSELDDGFVFEGGELADAHPGAGQQLHHEPPSPVRVLGQCGHEPGRRRIVQELGQRVVEDGEVGRVDREPGRSVVVVPLDDPLEERAQEAERCRMVVVDKGLPPLPGRAALPGLEVLDVGRPMAATDTQVGSAVVTRWAKSRRARSTADTVAGRDETSSCSR